MFSKMSFFWQTIFVCFQSCAVQQEGIMKSAYEVVSSSSPGEHHLPPIIFLHGMGDYRMTWKKVAPIIAKKTGRKAYLPDARNHGYSPRMDEMNYEVLTQDVVDFMDDQGIRKAIIVGHSMGARTAINFALKHPERTDAVVVVDMTPRNVKSANQTLTAEIFQFAKDLVENFSSDLDLKTAKQQFFEMFISVANGTFLNAENMRKHYDLDMMPVQKVGNRFVPLVDLDALSRLVMSNPLVQNLPELGLTFHGDALFLYGSKPFFNIAKDTSINKLFPRAMKAKIEGASHMVHLESSDAFSHVVSNFILYRNLKNSKY